MQLTCGVAGLIGVFVAQLMGGVAGLIGVFVTQLRCGNVGLIRVFVAFDGWCCWFQKPGPMLTCL